MILMCFYVPLLSRLNGSATFTESRHGSSRWRQTRSALLATPRLNLYARIIVLPVAIGNSSGRSNIIFGRKRWAIIDLPSSEVAGRNIPRLSRHARGFIPYAELPKVYASTRVVVDDANHVTKDWGSVNSRVFDALAAGALVVTNGELGSTEVFEGKLPVYRSRQNFRPSSGAICTMRGNGEA